MPRTVWDLASGYCPFGHPIEQCHRIEWKRQGVGHNRCSIQQEAKRQERREIERLRGRRRINPRPKVYKPPEMKHLVKITMVCTHAVYHQRVHSHGTHFWCERCDDWREKR